MHETSVAAKVVAACVEEARRRGLRQVRAVRLRVGALWGVAAESLELHVSLLAQGTALAGATVDVQTVPVAARCDACGTEVKDPRLDDPAFLHTLAHGPVLVEALLSCPGCKGGAVAIEQGRELEVAGVEG